MRHDVAGYILQRPELQSRDVCGSCGSPGLCCSAMKVRTSGNGAEKALSNCHYAPRVDMRRKEVKLRVSSTERFKTPMSRSFCQQAQHSWTYDMGSHVAAFQLR